ncbi:MAG: hypothetical protein HC887_12315 [Desulfobacteraceae bacterium]|nr:hypothetical protein [Desulfobacteraceae bacterium]
MKKIAMIAVCILLYATVDSIAAETKEITPSDAFAAADLAERNLDMLLDAKGIKEVRLLKKLKADSIPCTRIRSLWQVLKP